MAIPERMKKKSNKSPIPADFGKAGAPIDRGHPFYFGFVATVGALTAFVLMRALASASQVFVLILVALFLATGLNPAVEAIRRRGHTRSQHKWKEGMHVMVNDRHAIVLSNKAGDWVHNGSTVCQCGSETGIWTVKNRQGDSVYALKYDDVVYPCYVEGRTMKHYEENTSRKRQCREWSPFSSSSSSSSSSKPVAKRARNNDYDSGEEAELSDF